MRLLRRLLAAVLLLLAPTVSLAQRDPEKQPTTSLNPNLAQQPPEQERPTYALPGAVAVLSAIIVLVIVCMPSRKGA
jgi:hypothetical protein